MALDWGEKLLESMLGGVPLVAKLIPRRYQQRALARLNDVNPFAQTAASKDLLRALRLAWIEAALQVDGAARRAVSAPEWMPQVDKVERFSCFLTVTLRSLRSEAFDRDAEPGRAPMDRHLDELIVHVPATMAGHSPDAGEAITSGFRDIAAAVAGWPPHEVPAIYEQIARQGLPAPGTDVRRSFGDLVYAEFAETLKSPDRYPEASQAFVIAIGGLGVDLGRRCLALLHGQESKLDQMLQALDALPSDGGLLAWLARVDADWPARWKQLSAQVAAVDAKLDRQTGTLDLVQAQLEKLTAAIEAKGRIGAGPGQLAHDTVLALAMRLRPDEHLDLDQSIDELEAAVGVALDLVAKGHSSHYQDRFVDEVLAGVRQSIEAGQLEQGAASIDEALAALDEREAIEREAAKRRRGHLLAAAEEQAMLLRDPERVADAVEKLVSLDHPQRPAACRPFVDRLKAYYDEGETRGLRLPLDVAEALARRLLAHASGSDERGEALIWLGNALSTLGERESGTERLLQAVQAYEAALLERTRERVPMDWATTQSNLGDALRLLGQRESGTERLLQAVKAYEAALLERNRERVPHHFESVLRNLAEAQRLLLDRQQDNLE